MIKTYRKKPVEVKAVQFTGSNFTEVQEFTSPGFFQLATDRYDPEIVAEVWDKLHDTWVGVKRNNYIIEGVQGEFYPCDQDVFATTYDEVENP